MGLEHIGDSLRDPAIAAELIQDSISTYRGINDDATLTGDGDGHQATAVPVSDWFARDMAASVQSSINEAVAQIDRYCKGGERYGIRIHLTRLRNQWLAHRQVEPTNPTPQTEFDRDVEQCYQDMLKLIEALYHSVKKISYNPQETVAIRARHANLFWRGVRGERTEGHPDYKAPLVPPRPEQLKQ